ncbi:MAG: hypothetical protein FWC53_03235 [Firmicutes bacterium]|nr:hypothetical protein [Bacillota bacterium]
MQHKQKVIDNFRERGLPAKLTQEGPDSEWYIDENRNRYQLEVEKSQNGSFIKKTYTGDKVIIETITDTYGNPSKKERVNRIEFIEGETTQSYFGEKLIQYGGFEVLSNDAKGVTLANYDGSLAGIPTKTNPDEYEEYTYSRGKRTISITWKYGYRYDLRIKIDNNEDTIWYDLIITITKDGATEFFIDKSDGCEAIYMASGFLTTSRKVLIDSKHPYKGNMLETLDEEGCIDESNLSEEQKQNIDELEGLGIVNK